MEMIPVIVPSCVSRRKQIVAFVGATPMVGKDDATIWFYLAPTSYVDTDV